MKISKVMSLGLASAFIHGAVLVSLDEYIRHDRAVMQIQKQVILSNPKDELALEFIDTPEQKNPVLIPPKTKRISSQNALNQDQSRNAVADMKRAPLSKEENIANQIEKWRNESPQKAAPEAKAMQASEALEAPKAEEKVKPASELEDFLNQIEKETKEKSMAAQPKPEVKPQEASRAQEEVKGIQSPDKITTQEMSRAKSSGAALFGTTSFEATGSGMGKYMKNLKERIWSAWYPYLAFRYPLDFKGADAIISFTLNPDGEVKQISVIDDGGDANFASYCMQAILKASGFGQVPKEILAITGKDEFELKFGFHYR